MAPAPDEFSAPGAVKYESDTMTVGDGTWDFRDNTFLLPNLQGTNFETTRYNGMGNRFSSLGEYHTLVLAHGILAAFTFLLFIPLSVIIARFYTRRPGSAIKLHAQLNIVGALFLLALFMLGFFAVGPERSLTNPHHGIGVAIFVLFVVQLVGGRIVMHITKIRSIRIMMHQWLGRAIALLGIVQVALGLTLYGSPKYLFILYTLWMAFLLLVYFVLSYRSAGRRELYLTGGDSEARRTRADESEYRSGRDDQQEHSDKWKWLGPLAAVAGLWEWERWRKRKRDDGDEPSAPGAHRRSEVISSRRGSGSFLDDEKYSSVAPQRKKGGTFLKVAEGAAAAFGAEQLLSKFMNRRQRQRDDDYSAVSTETPRRHRPTRGTGVYSEFDSDLTGDPHRAATETSLLPPSARPPAMAGARSAMDSAGSHRPHTPEASRARYASGPDLEDSEYSPYVSPSRRPSEKQGKGAGVAEGILAGLGMGWIAKKMADRRARKQEDRLQDEDEMRSGLHGSRFTGDGYPSPSRRGSQRQPMGPGDPVRSEMTDSTFETRPDDDYGAPAPPMHRDTTPTRSRRTIEPVSMPPMPPDPRDDFPSDSGASYGRDRPQRAVSARRRVEGEAAAAAAAARASDLASEERGRYGSPHSQPVSVKVKMHDDRDRNVTLRRLTEEEAMAARGQRRRADSETSLSEMDSPSQGRTYRRDPSQWRAEAAAEQRAEEDRLGPLSPPDPAFARGRRAREPGYGGQAGPSGSAAAAGNPLSSLGSLASPESHGTWSGTSPPASGLEGAGGSSAADNRRRRRLERRRGSSSRPTGADMFE